MRLFAKPLDSGSITAARLGATTRVGFIALALVAACSLSDESAGSFDITFAGGIEGTGRGPVDAAHSSAWSGNGYRISLRLDSLSSQIGGVRQIDLWTQARPTSGGRYAIKPTANVDAADKADLVVSMVNNLVTWVADSGTLEFRSTPGRHAVAGEFTAFLTCPRCDPAQSLSRAVVRGQFSTHD